MDNILLDAALLEILVNNKMTPQELSYLTYENTTPKVDKSNKIFTTKPFINLNENNPLLRVKLQGEG